MKRMVLTAFVALAGWSSLAAETGPLRSAITSLAETCGADYPRAAEFLTELTTLERTLASGGNPAAAKTQLQALQRQALLANPLVSHQEILFVVRQQYRPDHHNTATFFPAAEHEYNDGAFTPGGALKALDVQTGKVRTLVSAPDGVVRDPEVALDGQRVVFAMRRNAQDSYHIYEVNADGTGLRQLTFARDVDDLDPLYLPDGGIAFSSTREPKYCMCNRHIMANLYRMESDGANIHQIGKSTLFEGHGSLMPDGRILYDRWEYVDRNFGDAQSLWTVNPDGTGHALFWGNNTASPGAVLDARILPGTELAICVFSSCHDRPWGALAILDRRLGMDGRDGVVRTWPPEATNLIERTGWERFDAFTQVRTKYEDPYPLSAEFFLCSRMTGQGEEMGIYLLDMFGNELCLHVEPPGCFDPMPLAPRFRPQALAVRRDYGTEPAIFYVQDVYRGNAMQNVPRGTVRWLRVVESPEKRFWTKPAWEGQGQEAPAMNWHDFNNKRILGTVPVEADGSAYFETPPDRFVYFQLLDARGMMVQSMRSGVAPQAGERASCIGCHEDRRQAPGPQPSLALLRAPSPLNGWHGPAREFSYRTEVQPVLDRRCVSCHDYGQPAGKVLNLAGDRDVVFNTSYNELWRNQWIRVVGAGPAETQPPRSWGSHASRLVSWIQQNARCGGTLTPEEYDRIVTWIDLNAPYYPTYASAYPANLAGRSPLTDVQLKRLEELTDIPIRQMAAHTRNRGPLVSFDRPELSPSLQSARQRSEAHYAEALDIIRHGQQLLTERPEADIDGFEASERDQWRNGKYLRRDQVNRANRDAIAAGERRYDAVD